jgi:hypothetical protein
MNPATKLDNEARIQQMKVSARQFAATMALELIKAPNYSVVEFRNDPGDTNGNSLAHVVGGKVDHITLLAMAGDIEKYILGDLEQEAKDAIEVAAKSFNAPKIVRP